MSADVAKQLIAAAERALAYLAATVAGRRPAGDHEDQLAGEQLAAALRRVHEEQCDAQHQ